MFFFFCEILLCLVFKIPNVTELQSTAKQILGLPWALLPVGRAQHTIKWMVYNTS